MQTIKRFWMEEDGAETVEWVVFGAVIAAALMLAGTAFNPALRDAFAALAGSLEAQAATMGPE